MNIKEIIAKKRDRNKLNIINMILKVKQGNQKILLM